MAVSSSQVTRPAAVVAEEKEEDEAEEEEDEAEEEEDEAEEEVDVEEIVVAGDSSVMLK